MHTSHAPTPEAAAGGSSIPPAPAGANPHGPSRPLHGGLFALLRFAAQNGMLRPRYVPLLLRWLYLKLRWHGRLHTDGICFVRPGVHFEIGRAGRVELGRWSWIGDGSKIRAHEGVISLGAKSVLGQECTLSCYQRIAIGRECIIADHTMMIDFDHNIDDVERPIRKQGIRKRDVRVGNNVWIGHGARVLRGVSVGDNVVIGTSAVVTHDVPDDAIVGGVPATVIAMRAHPRTLRWD